MLIIVLHLPLNDKEMKIESPILNKKTRKGGIQLGPLFFALIIIYMD